MCSYREARIQWYWLWQFWQISIQWLSYLLLYPLPYYWTQSVLKDVSWQLLLSARDERSFVKWEWRRWRGAGERGVRRGRGTLWEKWYKETEMEFLRALSVEIKWREKCWTSQGCMSHQQYTSDTNKEHFSFTWGEEVYGFTVWLWFHLRKLVRYWTHRHIIHLTLLVKDFSLTWQMWV